MRDSVQFEQLDHGRRYSLSWEWVRPHLTAETRVLDLGHGSPFRKALIAEGARVEGTDDVDLRYPLPHETDAYDLVLCMEVVEHLKDSVEAERATYVGDGRWSMLTEARRVLKLGGHLFLTTPNLACWHSLRLLLRGEHPYFFEQHEREITYRDVRGLLFALGFEVERLETVDVWHQHETSEDEVEVLRSLCTEHGFDTTRREDCVFALCRK